MNKKMSVGAALTLLIISVVLTVSVTMVVAMRYFNYNIESVNKRQAMFSYITDVDKEVRQHYLGSINETALRESLARGYVGGLGDKYAAFFTPDGYRKETDRLAGRASGLGFSLAGKDDGTFAVSAVDKNSPADRAGLQKGDVITHFNGEDPEKLGPEAMRAAMEAGGKLKMTVTRGENTQAFEISSSSYTLSSVDSRQIGTVGYLRIRAFLDTTPAELTTAVMSLESAGVTGMVFDLRDNAGGSLAAAQKSLSLLIPRGIYAYAQGSAEKTEMMSDGTHVLSVPTATLVNGATEGEAELFAAVMQSMKKTTVVGTTTAGRGMVLQFFPLQADGSAVRLSVAAITLADGSSYEGTGVDPTVESALNEELQSRFAFLTDEEDTQIQAALSALKGSAAASATTPYAGNP